MDKKDITTNIAALALRLEVQLENCADAQAALTALADAAATPLPKKILILGGQEMDVTNLPVFTLGDRKALKAQGMDMKAVFASNENDPDQAAKLILYLLKKRRPETTEADVEGLPAVVCTSFLQYYFRQSTKVDDPFSTRSTTSPTPTGGASASSNNAPQQI